jgi:hypothetical protein
LFAIAFGLRLNSRAIAWFGFALAGSRNTSRSPAAIPEKATARPDADCGKGQEPAGDRRTEDRFAMQPPGWRAPDSLPGNREAILGHAGV